MNRFILDVVASTIPEKFLPPMIFFEYYLISFINNISVFPSSTDRIIRRR